MMRIDDAAFARYMAAKHAEDVALKAPCISPVNAALLVRLLREKQAKNILEIGACHGTSTCYLAKTAAEWGGRVLSYEISDVSYRTALGHFKVLGLENIDLRNENALEALPLLAIEGKSQTKFDWAFIDAQKSRTLDFYLAIQPLLTGKAVVVIDDVMKYQTKMAAFWRYVREHHVAYTLHCVDQDDATMVIQMP